jgi:hypothetical protein
MKESLCELLESLFPQLMVIPGRLIVILNYGILLIDETNNSGLNSHAAEL